MGWLKDWVDPHLTPEQRARRELVMARRAKAQKWMGISIIVLAVVTFIPLIVLWRSF